MRQKIKINFVAIALVSIIVLVFNLSLFINLSNLLSPGLFITFFTGLLFILINRFFDQKEKKKAAIENKKVAAEKILEEIEYAEEQMNVARNNGGIFPPFAVLLLGKYWYDNIHLFKDDMEKEEKKLITDYYNKVSLLNNLIANSTQNDISKAYADYYSSKSEINTSNKTIADVSQYSTLQFNGDNIKQILADIMPILETSAINKLRKISVNNKNKTL